MKAKYCGRTYEDIKDYVESNGCKVITQKNDYRNYKTELQMICNCGKEFETSMSKFIHNNKRQCNSCGQKGNIINLTNKKFGHLTAIKLDEERINTSKKQGKYVTYWLCKCDCGNAKLKSVSYGALTDGGVKSCGCIHTLDLTGKRFYKLTVLSYAYSKNGHTYWNCKCDCGNETIVVGTVLNTGKSKSCGCYNAESKTKHGLSSHPLYKVYSTMKQRCYNSNSKDYCIYGEKGIIICDEWMNQDGFINFYNWAINTGYKKGLEIDRIDYEGNYEPKNCRWVNDIDQANNTSRNLNITIDNETKTFAEWCRIFNKNRKIVYNRVRNGWNIIEALTTETDGNQHFEKSKLIELNGENKTLREWCRIYDKNYSTVDKRISKGWDILKALITPTDGKKHFYNKN